MSLSLTVCSTGTFEEVLAADARQRLGGERSFLHRLSGVIPTSSSSPSKGASSGTSGKEDGAEEEEKGALSQTPTSTPTSLISDRRQCHHDAALSIQLTRERLARMESVLRDAEPTFEKIPFYVAKLKAIGKTMSTIEDSVRVMKKEVNEVYASSGLDKE